MEVGVLLKINIISDIWRLSNNKVAMVSGKRKSTSTVSDEEASNKLRKTGQGSRMSSKVQKLAMFKRPTPSIPLDQMPLGVLERLVTFLDVVTTISFFLLVLDSLHMLGVMFCVNILRVSKLCDMLKLL